MDIKSISIRIDEELLHKLHVVADYEGRSANGQFIVLARDCVEAYEAKNGKINISSEKSRKSKKPNKDE